MTIFAPGSDARISSHSVLALSNLADDGTGGLGCALEEVLLNVLEKATRLIVVTSDTTGADVP